MATDMEMMVRHQVMEFYGFIVHNAKNHSILSFNLKLPSAS